MIQCSASSSSSRTIITIGSQREHLTEAVTKSAERASGFSKKALRRGMAENNTDDIWRTIADLGNEPGIERIRVYDKSGIIRYIDVHDINDRPRLDVLMEELGKIGK